MAMALQDRVAAHLPPALNADGCLPRVGARPFHELASPATATRCGRLGEFAVMCGGSASGPAVARGCY